MLITLEQLKAIAPRGKADILTAVVDGINTYGDMIGLDKSKLRLAHFIAQCAHESDSFKTTREYGGSKTRYAPYFGRGIIQTTWEENYNKFDDWLTVRGFEHPNFKAKSNIDKVALFPWAFLSAVAYWDRNNLNRFADADDTNGLTKAINGGYNGLEDRKQYLAKAKAVLGLSSSWAASSGDDIVALQKALIAKGFSIEADGVMGPRTIAAIRLFQKFSGIKVDGVAGPVTKKALGL